MKTILFISLLFFVTSCEKKSDCPLQTYKIQCAERSPDAVFGGYNTATKYYNIQANCPEDADREAKNMSYQFGGSYKRCYVMP